MDVVGIGSHSMISPVSFFVTRVCTCARRDQNGIQVTLPVLLGAMFASHTLLAFPIVSRLGIVKSGAVTTVLGATLLTDLLALLVLAVVTGSQGEASGAGFWVRLLAFIIDAIALGILTAARAPIFGVGMLVDPRIITGAPAWLRCSNWAPASSPSSAALTTSA